MLKSQYFVLAALLLTGTSLGFMDVFHFGEKTDSISGDQKTFFSRNAPLFGGKKIRGNIDQITPSLANMESLVSQYAEMSPEEIKTELKRLLKFSQENKNSSLEINIFINYLGMKLGSEFPNEVQNFIENDLKEKNQDLTLFLVRSWAQNDFDGAMDFLLKQDNRLYVKGSIFSEMIYDLTHTNPEKSFEWCFSRTGKVRSEGLSSVINALADYHPDKMSDFVGKLQEKDLKDKFFLEQLSKKWGECDWDTAIRWADSLKGYKKKNAIIDSFKGLVSKDLSKATEEFKKQPEEYHADIAWSIVTSIDYNYQNLEAEDIDSKKQVFDWILTNIPNDIYTQQIVKNCMSTFLMTPEFTNYVQNLPEGKVRDAAFGRMAEMIRGMVKGGEHSFEESFGLIEQITDPETRKKDKSEMIYNWIYDAPEKARIWIVEKSDLSDEEKQERLIMCDAMEKRNKADQ